MFWLWNKDQGHWPSQGAKLWPFKGAKTGVFRFSRGVTYSEYLSWLVANTISLLTAILIIDCCPPPVLGHHPSLVGIHDHAYRAGVTVFNELSKLWLWWPELLSVEWTIQLSQWKHQLSYIIVFTWLGISPLYYTISPLRYTPKLFICFIVLFIYSLLFIFTTAIGRLL